MGLDPTDRVIKKKKKTPQAGPGNRERGPSRGHRLGRGEGGGTSVKSARQICVTATMILQKGGRNYQLGLSMVKKKRKEKGKTIEETHEKWQPTSNGRSYSSGVRRLQRTREQCNRCIRILKEDWRRMQGRGRKKGNCGTRPSGEKESMRVKK